MQRWMILVLIVLILWLISRVRIGAVVQYDSAGLLARVRFGPVRFTVFPIKKKDKPSKPTKKKKPSEEVRPKPPVKGGNLELVRKFLPFAAEAAGRLKEKILIESIKLEVIWGARDPAAAAIGFGMANAALGMLWPVIEHNFKVRHRRLSTSVDYDASVPAVTIHAALSLTLGQCVVLGVVLGIKVLKLLRNHKKEQKLKEAV